MHIPILHVGDSVIPGSKHPLLLKDVLYAPNLSKNLLSANKLGFDNNCFVELHPDSFLVKDRTTRATLLHGRSQGGLYPVSPQPRHPATRRHQAHLTAPSKELWHRRLGHPASPIVQAILSTNKLVSSSNKESVSHVCDACQQAKVHQLPYELS